MHALHESPWLPPSAVGSTVLVVPDDAETRTASGLHLAVAIQRPTGVVVAVGPRVEGVRLGDRVVCDREPAASYAWDGVRLWCVSMTAPCPRCGAEREREGILGVFRAEAPTGSADASGGGRAMEGPGRVADAA